MYLARVQKLYRAMAHTAYEIVQLKNLLMELDFRQSGPMHMDCDNQSASTLPRIMYSMKEPSTLRFTVILLEMLALKKMVIFQFTLSSKQLADLLIKAVSPQVFSNLCNKLGMLDIYAPA